MPSVGTIAAALVSAPAPVLLLDACALLDIIRAPRRSQADHLRAVSRVLQAASASPARCVLVTASITRKEFDDHAAEEVNQLGKHLQGLQDQAIEFETACQHAGITSAPAASAFTATSLPAVLESLARSVLGAAISIDGELRFRNLATQRAIDGRRPSRHGAVKDPLMLEEYLELCRVVRSGGFASPVVFLSSNPADFCQDKSASHLHSDLAAEFTPLALGFAAVWPRAAQLLSI